MALSLQDRPPRTARRRRNPLGVLALVLVVAGAVGIVLGPARGAFGGSPGTSTSTSADLAAVQAPSAPPLSDEPGLAGVDAELARRFVAARESAAAQGVALTITSGARTAEEQQALVDEAIDRYGSKEEASRWVLPPESSAHVKGLALDVGDTDGALWLGQHGIDFGLCRTYANEVWHFEMLPADRTTCPPMHEDSSSGW